jgi:RimJ/RimL family protein N-acetyltransferase
MFARTERLLLRPGFQEDSAALSAAMESDSVVRNLAGACSPYQLAPDEAFPGSPRDPVLPSLLITERTDKEPRIVGGCGLTRRPSGTVEIDFWVARDQRGRGIATEAGLALLGIARALRFPSVYATHFLDNPASGRVLEKLGFNSTGIVAPRFSLARRREAAARTLRLSLSDREMAPLAA